MIEKLIKFSGETYDMDEVVTIGEQRRFFVNVMFMPVNVINKIIEDLKYRVFEHEGNIINDDSVLTRAGAYFIIDRIMESFKNEKLLWESTINKWEKIGENGTQAEDIILEESEKNGLKGKKTLIAVAIFFITYFANKGLDSVYDHVETLFFGDGREIIHQEIIENEIIMYSSPFELTEPLLSNIRFDQIDVVNDYGDWLEVIVKNEASTTRGFIKASDLNIK